MDATLPANGFVACVEGGLGDVPFCENAVDSAAKTNASNRLVHATRSRRAACEAEKSFRPRDGEGDRRLEIMAGDYN